MEHPRLTRDRLSISESISGWNALLASSLWRIECEDVSSISKYVFIAQLYEKDSSDAYHGELNGILYFLMGILYICTKQNVKNVLAVVVCGGALVLMISQYHHESHYIDKENLYLRKGIMQIWNIVEKGHWIKLKW